MTLQDELPLTGPGTATAGRSVGTRYPYAYAVLDVETTGFSARRDRVLQVALTLLDADGREEGSWSTLVDPGCDPGPVHVHGITTDRLVGAPRFSDVAGYLASLLAGRVFVAHNARFDWGFVTAEMARADQPLSVGTRLCTRNLAKRLDLPVENLKLATLAAHWEIEQLQAHDAADDTRVLVQVLRNCLAVADRHGVDLPFTTGPDAREDRPVGLPPGAVQFLTVRPATPAPAGDLAGHRVLVLGGPHDVAARVRAGIALRGGTAAVSLSAGTTDVVVLTGGEADPRHSLVRRLGLRVLDVRPAPGGRPPVALPLSPDQHRWLLDVRWGHIRDPVDVVVIPWRAGVPTDERDGLRQDRSTLGDAEVSVALHHLADGVDGVLLVAELPAGTGFGDVGGLEFTLRSPDGAAVLTTTVDARATERTVLLGGVFRTGETWWFRSGGS